MTAVKKELAWSQKKLSIKQIILENLLAKIFQF